MRKSPSSTHWKMAVAVTMALAGLLSAWTLDRRSSERANRIYREGALREAAMIYADRLGRDPASAELRYNFGTALLSLGDERAGEELARAGSDTDGEIRVRALYNLGLWDLTEALKAEGSDSARAHALNAVAANKNVLRLRPGSPNAGWNLALALRLLDSIDTGAGASGLRSSNGAVDRDGAPVPPHEPRDAGGEQAARDGPRAAEGETAARAGEIAPLSLIEASEIVGTGHRDPTKMVGKLMAFEGRALRLRASGRLGDGR